MIGVAAVTLFVVVAAVYLFGATYVARDADARGHDGRLIGLAWLLVWPVGLLLWLMTLRSPRIQQPASNKRSD